MPWTDTPPTEGPLLADRYRLVSRIGEGGMAGVYRAWDERLRVWRAAKVLLPEFARKDKLRRRFEREAHTMARLEHRNLVRVVDVGTSGSLPFIVMELVPCGTLMQWVELHGPMPEALAVDALIQVGEGLGEVHRNGVIHRDIKPHNVLINEQGVCKITDFGIAQESEEGLTRAGSVMGTMGYMAPEQRNDAAAVDQRADIYGFGATLWKLITGRPLRDLFMYTEDEGIMEGIDPTLAEVLMACLAYSRKDRPESMEEVVDALRAVREALPDSPPGTPELPIMGTVEKSEAASATFAEISAAFTLSESPQSSEMQDLRPPVNPGATNPGKTNYTEPPKPLPGLPYGLPQRMEAPKQVESSGTPSWLVEDDPTTDEAPHHGGYDIRPDSGFVAGGFGDYSDDEMAPTTYFEAASQEAAVYMLDEPSEEPTDHAEAPKAQEPQQYVTQEPAQSRAEAAPEEEEGLPINVGLVLKVAVFVLFVGGASVGGLFFWARSVVVTAADQSSYATQSFYAALSNERNVATELVHFDRNATVLEGLYLDYLDQKREPERWERAMTLVDELAVYGTAAEHETSDQAKQVQGRLSRVQAARAVAVNGRRAWLDASSSFPGVLAASIGLAPSPSFDVKALESK